MKPVPPLLVTTLAITAVLSAGPGAAQGSDPQGLMAYAVPELRLPAPEARQGVASDGESVFAIDDSEIGKYAIASGERVGGFKGDAATFPHLNSCILAELSLVCAASNYPRTPHEGRIEFFDPAGLRHRRTVVLADNPGSLTVVDRHGGHWWAVFANYDGKGGVAGQDHRTTRLARLTDDFAVERTWTLPQSVLERIAPKSISGGVWGSDGLFYASGHDKPELYVLALPASGSTLRHVATIATSSFGQAIALESRDQRRLWSIDRTTRTVIASRLPELGDVK